MTSKLPLFLGLFLFTFYYSIGQDIPIPSNCSVLESVQGDLDKDDIDELVVVYNEVMEAQDGVYKRPLIIYKKNDEEWVEWKRSDQALYNSDGGGVLGDPYDGIEIRKGILEVRHFGGSNSKWRFTDKYRFQDEAFYLIGYTHFSWRPCNYFEEVDFNLSTGKMNVKKEIESCDGEKPEITKTEKETCYQKGLKIKIEERQKERIIFTTPKYKFDVYVAMGQDW
jgi:hypothetical protein